MAATPRKTLVIVPTYNESENIVSLLESLRKSAPEVDILVVDDTSPDGTFRIVQDLQKSHPTIHLLIRSEKQGLAAAYVAGFRWGLERDYQQLIQMDADFSHAPQDVPRIAAALANNDVVSGSRYTAGGSVGGWGWLRQVISRGGNWYARGILRLGFSDLTGGFNGWRREVLERIDIGTLRSRGYAFQVELKYRAHRAGFQLAEIPIRFENRRLGKSKMSGSIVWEAALRVWQMRHWVVV